MMAYAGYAGPLGMIRQSAAECSASNRQRTRSGRETHTHALERSLKNGQRVLKEGNGRLPRLTSSVCVGAGLWAKQAKSSSSCGVAIICMVSYKHTASTVT